MPLMQKINPFAKANNDTGFGTTAGTSGGRFVQPDGSFNVHREGRGRLRWFSMYHTMLSISTSRFLFTVLLCFLGVNLAYTLVYTAIGFSHFQGLAAADDWGRMRELFYFSMQTFTTVGYGRINPQGDLVSLVAGLEALSGLLAFAWATGLMYGRFVRPRANLQFSRQAVVAPYRGVTALMFRFVALKEKHTLTGVGVRVNLFLQLEEHGQKVFRFFDLELERSHIDSLPMNFTVVHPIDDKSPLYGMQAPDFEKADLEVFVQVQAFDDVYSATVQQRTSYTWQEIAHGRKFVPMYRESEDGSRTVLEMDKLNDTVAAPLA